MTVKNTKRLPKSGDFASDDAGHESIVRCTAALLRAGGLPIAADELSCVLGTAWMTSHASHAVAERRWNVFGRHACLVEAMTLYGLELRALHPPDAAPSPPTPREFAWHFRDSYLPLFRASLEEGEPILAWMGWSSPHESDWGLITGMEQEACVGLTPGGRSVLRGPAIQVYQVIMQEPRRPSPMELTDRALRHARIVVNNRLDPSFGVETGLAAVEAMEDRLRSFAPSEEEEAASMADLVAKVLQAVVRGREAASSMFSEWLPLVDSSTAAVLAECLTLLGNTAGGLSPWIERERIASWMRTPSPWKSVEPVMELWRTSEEALASALNRDRR